MRQDLKLKFLIESHKNLNIKIDKMEKSNHFKDEELVELKKQRLFLKDQIEQLEKKELKNEA
jgi:uncharacterized protein YdcH (DUF465 family)